MCGVRTAENLKMLCACMYATAIPNQLLTRSFPTRMSAASKSTPTHMHGVAAGASDPPGGAWRPVQSGARHSPAADTATQPTFPTTAEPRAGSAPTPPKRTKANDTQVKPYQALPCQRPITRLQRSNAGLGCTYHSVQVTPARGPPPA